VVIISRSAQRSRSVHLLQMMQSLDMANPSMVEFQPFADWLLINRLNALFGAQFYYFLKGEHPFL
jgi:hypothetical protein